MFVDVIVNTRSNILVRCEAVFQVLDPSFVTLRDYLQLANVVQQRLHFDSLQINQSS